MLDENIKLPEEDNTSTSQNSETNEKELKQEAAEEIVEESVVEVAKEIIEETIQNSEHEATADTTDEEDNTAINEIDDEIAASSEGSTHENLEDQDYSSLSLEDLVAELTKLVRESPVQSIQNNVNSLKNAFNIKFGEILRKEKAKFIEEGGNVIDFQYSNPIKTAYNSILYDYKVKRNEFYAGQENSLKKNLEAKLEIIEELKHLIDNADGTTMYKIFKDIQSKWREVGPIPRAKYNDAWKTYHHHVERFYDF